MPAESYSDARLDSVIGELAPIFRKEFGVTGDSDVEWLLFSYAPGRVNFIGEHVDYMGGWVCPAAVSDGTHIVVGRVRHLAAAAAPPRLRYYATYTNEHFDLTSLDDSGAHNKSWTTFVRGATAIRLRHLGVDLAAPQLRGVCMVVHGTLAMGAGMSASAAFGVALLHAIDAVVRGSYSGVSATPSRRYAIMPRLPAEDLIEIAKQGRRIEIEYCGVNVGIMDQFASALSETDKFMFLDCTNLQYETLSLQALLGDDYEWLLIDSMIKHDLLGGTGKFYNKVRSDQEDAQTKISRGKLNGAPFTFSELVRHTRTYAPDGDAMRFMRSCKHLLTQDEYERGSYQVAEQLRTLDFKRIVHPHSNMMHSERVRRVGAILNEAHKGMKELLKVTTPELDYIQELINEDADVAGGRMMGGGFGGCVILLLKKSARERVIATVQQKFKQRFNVVNTCFPLERAGCGTFLVSLEGLRSGTPKL